MCLTLFPKFKNLNFILNLKKLNLKNKMWALSNSTIHMLQVWLFFHCFYFRKSCSGQKHSIILYKNYSKLKRNPLLPAPQCKQMYALWHTSKDFSTLPEEFTQINTSLITWHDSYYMNYYLKKKCRHVIYVPKISANYH